MKQKTLGLLACTALLCACQPDQKQTTITGTLAGVESDTLIVNYFAVSDLSRSTSQNHHSCNLPRRNGGSKRFDGRLPHERQCFPPGLRRSAGPVQAL